MTFKPTPRQLEILDAAFAVLATNPAASMADIAIAAGIGRATLHRHFGTREVLFAALSRQAIREIDDATAHLDDCATALDALRELFEVIVPLGDRFHVLTFEPALLGDPELAVENQRQLDELRELVDALRQEGVVAPDVPAAWGVAAIDALIYAAWTAVQDGSIAKKDAPGLALRTVLSGLGVKGDSHD